jgi:hypothetical protein
MADAYTQVPADSTGDKIDTEELTVSAQTVNRQRVQIAGTADVDISPVSATNGLLVNLGSNNDVTVAFSAAEAAALPGSFAVVAGDDGVDTHPLQVSAAGDLKITLDSEAVVLGAGTAEIGKLAAGTANIGDVDVLTAPATAADAAAGLPAVLAVVGGYDGTNVRRITTDASGNVQTDIVAELPAGTQNIGDVDVATIAAGTTLIGSVSLDIDGSDGGTLQATKFASIDVATSGDNTIITAVAGKQFRILSYVIVASGGANTCQWKSAATNKSGGMGLAANGGVSAESMWGVMQGGTNENFILNLSAATSVDGHIAYVEV